MRSPRASRSAWLALGWIALAPIPAAGETPTFADAPAPAVELAPAPDIELAPAPDIELAPAPLSEPPGGPLLEGPHSTDAPAEEAAAPPAGPELGLTQALELRPGLARLRDALAARARYAADRVVRRLPPDTQQGLHDLETLTFSPAARRTIVHLLAAFIALVLLARLVRGRGDLCVSIEYPSELRGTFTVRLMRLGWSAARRARVASGEQAERVKRRARTASRSVHPLVARETRFAGLAARRYVVEVDGFLQSSGQDAVVTSRREQRAVRVRSGRTERLEFDFHPRECPVEVKITWDGRPVADALVGVRSRPDSVRYARGSGVRLGIPLGRHVLLAGSGDRVAALPLEVASFQPTAVGVDLADRAALVFTGCPPAVEPYLHGDVTGAARALERDGQTKVAHQVLAIYEQERGRLDVAARHYEEAGEILEAARLCESLRDFRRSADLYQRAGDLQRAAEMYRSAGDLVRAGEAYEQARLFESAVECFREASDVGRWIDALERHGSAFRAAQVAMQHDDWGRAIRCLEQVSAHDPHYTQAAELLVGAYQRQGHLDLAARKIEELVARRGEDHVPLEICNRLATLLEESGDYERALDVLELIRRRDATWPELAGRIEELRKRRSRERLTDPVPRIAHREFSDEFRYELLDEVGRGGMGVVYRARDRRLGRVVALKQLPDNLRNHPKAVELFLREARAAAALNHPNIVTLFDAGQEGDTYYITMELLEGYPLQKILKSRGRFGMRDAAKLAAQVAHGLHYAHQKGIVHRDIKTGNLFFTKGKVVKIMDFGLAKMVEEVRRSTTVIGGTPYYMAPEQSQGGAVDHRVDVYALGVTLFEFLTGKVPFDDGDVAYHHRHTPPPDPRGLVPELPDGFAELLLSMLAKDPAERCPSAGEVEERLQEIARQLKVEG